MEKQKPAQKVAFILICLGLMMRASAAVTPTLTLWSSERRTVNTAVDRIDTNRLYVATRAVEVSGNVQDPGGGEAVVVEDLLVRMVLPAGVALSEADDLEAAPGMYALWEPAQTALVTRTAGPLTNGVSFRITALLVDSNAWLLPPVDVSRACDVARIGALGVITQSFVVTLGIAPGSLAGCESVEVSLPDWPYQQAPVQVSLAGSAWPSAFEQDLWGALPSYHATNPASLGGFYTFTNVLTVSNTTTETVDFMPQAEARCVERVASLGAARRGFVQLGVSNGPISVISAPHAVIWDGQWRQGETVLTLAAKWSTDVPALTDIKCVRAATIAVNGLDMQELMFSAEGANLMGGLLVAPGGETWDMEPEGGEGLYFEPGSRHAADLAGFTNGSYRIDLLGFTNGVAVSYAFDLRGGSVTQAPAFRSPGPFTNQPRPLVSWPGATPTNVSAVLLILNNAWQDSEEFQMWPGAGQTNHVPENDLFAAIPCSLMYADVLSGSSGGASLLSGYVSQRRGLFNVLTNEAIPAAVHLAAEPAATVVDQPVALGVVNGGLFPGAHVAFQLFFGDGGQTNAPYAQRSYAAAGIYTARVVAADELGIAATGFVAVAVYPSPAFDTATRTGALLDLSLFAVSGAVYRAYCADSLRPQDWMPMAMVLSGTGGPMRVHTALSTARRFYRLESSMPESGGNVGFEPLEFPVRRTGDIIRVAAFGIPNWSGTDPHNGIDLEVNHGLASSEIVSPVTGVVERIEASETPFSEPPGQLMVTVTIRTPLGTDVSLVLEPSTADPVVKTNQLNAVHVSEGQGVGVGTPVADLIVGALGYPHLHYMVMRGDEFVCPYGYSSPAAQAIFESLAGLPGSSLPDGNICYGEP
ncbi:MAG TPA: hypothetical protein P5567_03070 [Kiritimatiellia bacterium]|nr:hypothetical protein [Kiritimatiellia bacterium]HRZ11415.1 hypothetical protein [Kiritimatiellia bacterium]HSA17034.1 hypothetical protein [Kiritimatiellia bacterium]